MLGLMGQTLTIGQLATAANVPRSTVRFYERRRLLLPASRSPHGYRQYDQASVQRLRFIRAAQESGFSLDDIASLLALRDQPEQACEDVQQIIERRLAGVHEQIVRLQHVATVLNASLTTCQTCSVAQGCQMLDQLDQQTSENDASPCGKGSFRGACQ